MLDGIIDVEMGGRGDELMKAHPLGAKMPQECGSFMTTSCQSSNPVMISRIPDVYRWFLGADVTFRCEVHKMWLQHLSWRNSRKHWVLKIQEHMYSLPELRSVYPDAIFVQPHRDPTTVIASISQLIRVLRTPAYDEQDPIRSEEHTSELQSLMRISYAVFCLKNKQQTQQTT